MKDLVTHLEHLVVLQLCRNKPNLFHCIEQSHRLRISVGPRCLLHLRVVLLEPLKNLTLQNRKKYSMKKSLPNIHLYSSIIIN